MPIVHMPKGFPAFQLDTKELQALDPKARSCVGALYLRPNSTKFLTQPELDAIKKHDAKLARRLVIKVDDATLAVAELAAKAEPKAEAEYAAEPIKGKAKAKAEASGTLKAPELPTPTAG